MNPDILALILIGGSLLVSISVAWFCKYKHRNIPIDAVDRWNRFRADYSEIQWRYNSQWNRENNAK